MTIEIINTGTLSNDGTGDSIRDAFTKINNNFGELYSSLGLNNKLSFINLSDVTPQSYTGLNDGSTTPVLTVNNIGNGVTFKKIVSGAGIHLDYTTNSTEIIVSSAFNSILTDPNPTLGGDLNTLNGSIHHKIVNLLPPINPGDASNKFYADTKISLAGINDVSPSFGQMTGPLLLSRDPVYNDRSQYNGSIAATQNYVDQNSNISKINLFVSTSGTNVTSYNETTHGRSLSSAYKTLGAALKTAETIINQSPIDIGPYKKLLTYGGNVTGIISSITVGASTTFTTSTPHNLNTGASVTITTTGTLPTGVVSGTTYYVISTGRTSTQFKLALTLTGNAITTTGTYSGTIQFAGINISNNLCTIDSISAETGYGSGFRGSAIMTVATITLDRSNIGYGYLQGDMIALWSDSTTNDIPAVVQVLSVTPVVESTTVNASTPGYITTFSLVSGGLYSSLQASASYSSTKLFTVALTATATINGQSTAVSVVTYNSHGLTNNSKVSFYSINGTTGLSTFTTYYAINITTNTFQLASSIGGSAISFTINGTGSIIGLSPNITNANFILSFKVNSVKITTPGTGYSLSCLQVSDGNGNVAYGNAIANISTGAITKISITNTSTAFTSIPTVTLTLPKISINTNGLGTDYTANGLIRGGMYLKGATSGALAQILVHNSTLSGNDEIFDVNMISGIFSTGENVYFGIAVPTTQITIFVESGTYTEHYPLKIPTNVSIIGDDSQRTIIQPKNIISASPWISSYFKRDLTIDGLSITSSAYGYQYLTNVNSPIYTKVSNVGSYVMASTLLSKNKTYIQSEVVAWIDSQISLSTLPFTSSFVYNKTEYYNHFGNIIDAIIYDLQFGDSNRIVAAAFAFYESNPNYIRTTQLSQLIASINILYSITNTILLNSAYTSIQAIYSQVIDKAIIAESDVLGGTGVIYNLINLFKVIVTGTDPLINNPKSSNLLDVFLCNDATSIRGISCQGHGGFMTVLDPAGQILSKSPIINDCVSISNSTNLQQFAGGCFVDGFSGNLLFTVTSVDVTKLLLSVSGLLRYPALPCSILVNNTIYRVSYIKNFVYSTSGSTAILVLDSNTPWPSTNTNIYLSGSSSSYELITAGNRSIILDSVIQFNDMGYGLVATNGGIIEAENIATYYNYASFYAINGGQVKSVDGSSSYGVYGLVAESSDPSEVPVTSDLYYDLSQAVTCYALTTYTNSTNGLIIYVYNAQYAPQANSELEIQYTGYLIYKYQITSVAATSISGVYQLNIGGSTGLYAAVSHNTTMVLRCNSQIILVSTSSGTAVGNLLGRSVRPSTGLQLSEDLSTVYRALSLSSYTDGIGPYTVQISSGGVCNVLLNVTGISSNTFTTNINHYLSIGDVIITPSTGIPTGLTASTTYYIISVPTYTTFTISTSSGGTQLTGITNTSTAFNVIKSHHLNSSFPIQFSSTGTLPTGLLSTSVYYVSSTSLSATSFLVSPVNGGIAITSLTGGTGTYSYQMYGLATATFSTSYNYISLVVYTPGDYSIVSITTQTITTISGANFTSSGAGFATGTPIMFKTVSGTLPIGIDSFTTYYVVSGGSTFTVSSTLGGTAIVTSGTSSGVLAGAITQTVTVSGATFTASGAGFALNSVIKFTLSLSGTMPSGIDVSTTYFVVSSSGSTFTVSTTPGGTAITTTGTASGLYAGIITGNTGDSTFAISTLSPSDEAKVVGTTFVFGSQKYIITSYYSQSLTGQQYSRITLNQPLAQSIQLFNNPYIIRSGVSIRTTKSSGLMKSKISLVRSSGHDLNNIGTGSYSNTNYPNDIFGNPITSTNPANEVVERNVGRVLSITTDQWGVVNIGKYLSVDQGTGQVTLSYNLNISNLPSLGFKSGVSVNKFSIDNTFSGDSNSTVPTEHAIRQFIDKRLGVDWTGSVVTSNQQIPQSGGGFMALSGVLPMYGNMSLGSHQINNLSNGTLSTDAINLGQLQSYTTLEHLINYTANGTPASANLLTFTGSVSSGNYSIQNSSVTGDITLVLSGGILTSTISAGSIVDSKVSSTAAIQQSKLSMNISTAIASAPSGSNIQSSSGLSSFDSSIFNVTNGWVSLLSSGLSVSRLANISASSVIGNSTLSTGACSAVSFNTVVSAGMLSMYGSASGYLQYNTSTGFSVVNATSASSSYVNNTDSSKLIVRDSNGDFGGRNCSVYGLNLYITGSASSPPNQILKSVNGLTNQIIHSVTGSNASYGLQIVSDSGTTSNNVINYFGQSHNFYQTAGDTTHYSPVVCQGLTAGSGNGLITGSWTLSGSSSLESTYAADIAEYYEGDASYPIGTVLVFGGEKEVTISSKLMDTAVAGVVSNNAALSMYRSCKGMKNLIALQGRVPCNVVGKIKKGDLLVTSRIRGVAVTATGTVLVGTVIGKSLEDYDSDHIGQIEVSVGRT